MILSVLEEHLRLPSRMHLVGSSPQVEGLCDARSHSQCSPATMYLSLRYSDVASRFSRALLAVWRALLGAHRILLRRTTGSAMLQRSWVLHTRPVQGDLARG